MTPRRPVVGLLTIGQSPREDIVPDMAETIGPGVEILEAGVLDGLDRERVAALAPRPGDEVLVTRLRGEGPVFLGKERIVPLVEKRIAALEGDGATICALLCTGAFPPLRGRRLVIRPQPVLVGALRALTWTGPLGVLVPSVPHVPQAEARWRADGFEPVVAPLSPYEEDDPVALARAGAALRTAGAGVVVMDCMGFRRKTRDELAALVGAPVLLANLLLARVLAELCSA